jgi:regulator of protease activity HflC (stomatin/prohibitin superfamily)
MDRELESPSFRVLAPAALCLAALCRQAEAERERRAKIINAEGEFQAAEKLAAAAHILDREPSALQLRYLQTLLEIGADKNSTIVFPLPLDLLEPFLRRREED